MKHRYKIDVEGTRIIEYYEFDEALSPKQVREIWLDDAADKFHGGVAQAFEGAVTVTMLTEPEDEDDNQELEPGAIALPGETQSENTDT